MTDENASLTESNETLSNNVNEKVQLLNAEERRTLALEERIKELEEQLDSKKLASGDELATLKAENQKL